MPKNRLCRRFRCGKFPLYPTYFFMQQTSQRWEAWIGEGMTPKWRCLMQPLFLRMTTLRHIYAGEPDVSAASAHPATRTQAPGYARRVCAGGSDVGGRLLDREAVLTARGLAGRNDEKGTRSGTAVRISYSCPRSGIWGAVV